MLHDSFHQKKRVSAGDGHENYALEFHPNTWKNSFGFSSRLSFIVISCCYHKWFGSVPGGRGGWWWYDALLCDG